MMDILARILIGSISFSGFGSDPKTSKYEVYATVPKIEITGKYKVSSA